MIKVQVLNGDRVRKEIEVEEGTSVRDCVRLIEDGRDEFQIPTMALANGEPLLRKENGWEQATVTAEFQIVFVELPLGGGGGSSGGMIVRALATVAAIAVSWIPGIGQVTAALLMMAITLVGSLIAMAIDRQSMGQIEQESAAAASPTYNINSTGNQIRMFQPEPEGFGRMRIVPDYVAQSFTEFSSNDQYGYFIYGVGRGEYQINAMYYGDTVFWQDGNFVESGLCSEDGEEFSTKYDEVLPVGGSWYGPLPAVGAGEVSKTIRITVNFPNGYGIETVTTGYVEDVINGDPMNGNMRAYTEYHWTDETATILLQYAEIDDAGNVIGDWSATKTYTAKREGKRSWRGFSPSRDFSRTISFKASKYARWAVRIKNGSEHIPYLQVQRYVPGQGYVWVDDPDTSVYETMKLTGVASTALSAAVQIVPPDGQVTLFPTNVLTTEGVTNFDLYAKGDEDYPPNGGWVGPFAANTPGTQTNKIKIDYVYSNGLGRYNENGGLGTYQVDVEAQARKVDDLDNYIGEWIPLGSWSDSAKTTTPQRKTRSFKVDPGRYYVRVRRTSTSAKNADRTPSIDNLQWVGLRAVLPGQLKFPQTVIAVKLKATNALNQQSGNDFSCIVTRKLPIWDPQTGWSESPQPTRSWAAAVCAVCQERWGGGMSDSQIDLETIWAIDARLQAKRHRYIDGTGVEKNVASPWYFDAYIDGAYNLWQLVLEMCQSVCVAPRLTGTVLSFVQDEPGRPVNYELNARNIIRGSFQVTYATWSDDSADDVIMDYLDADANFQQRDVQATLQIQQMTESGAPVLVNGKPVVVRSDSESNEPATLNWIGITDRVHAFRVATRYASMNRWRRVTVTCQVEALGRLMQVGDVVSVNHPRFRNTQSGIVSGYRAASYELHLESDFTSEDGSEEYISLTRPNGSVWGPVKLDSLSDGVAVINAADYANFLLQGEGHEAPWSWISDGTSSQPTTYALHATKQFQRRMLVQSVSADDTWTYTLTLVNDAPEVSQYDTMHVPAWNGRAQTNTILHEPRNLSVKWTAATGIATVSWRAVQGAIGYEVQHSADGATWAHDGTTAGTTMTIANAEVQNWSGNSGAGAMFVRVAAISNAQTSQWAEWPGELAPTVKNFRHGIVVDSGSYTVSGNALNGATLGNGAASLHTFTWGPETSKYGTGSKNADGTYTYTLTNSNTTVQALATGDSLSEKFTFSYSDANGDAASGFVEIVIYRPEEE